MPIGNVAKRRGKAKVKISAKREAAMQRIMDMYSEDLDVRISLIQDLIPVGLEAVAEELKAEVSRLAGEKHSRVGSNARWGHQNGSVYLQDQKLPIKVPRLRNVDLNTEVPLETYRRLQTPRHNDSDVMRKLLHGLSTHKYHESSSLEITLANRIVREFKNRYKILDKDDVDDLVQECLTHWYFARQRLTPAKKVLKITFMAKVTRTKLLQIIREYRTDKRKISSLSESTDEEIEEGIDEDQEKDLASLELMTLPLTLHSS